MDQRRRSVFLGFLGVIFLAGWLVLVALAIDRGRSSLWGPALGLAVGAAGCLFVALGLFARRRRVRRGELAARRTPSHRG